MALLSTHDLTAYYGDFQALFGVDIELAEGEAVAIIGANGAGKTTLMRSITGVVNNVSEMIKYGDRPIGAMAADDVMALGVSMVPEGRRLFPSLSIEENLLVGAYRRQGSKKWNLKTIYELFPVLGQRRHSPGTALSGGQQQMVAIGRALMSNPDLLLCDEISLGLAPVIIKDIYAAVQEIRSSGTSLLVVEQDIGQALAIADRVYCMMEGRITLTGKPDELSRDDIHDAYFGVHA